MNSTLARPTLALVTALSLAACGGGDTGGTVQIDGSSTVFPIMEAVVEEFQKANPRVRATVGISGTGGGFRRFCAGETDISNASRPISDGEREECAENGVEFTEIPVAWDGLSVVVNPENDFATCLTTDELTRIWAPGSTLTSWAEVRDGFPDEPITLYGAGTSSGTFDYFTEAINGESGASRPDYQASEDDNVLVQGVAGDRLALGYFGYAYYIENQSRVKALQIDGGNGCVLPRHETIEDGSYFPLSRPLFIYVSHASAQRPEVEAFLNFTLDAGPELIPPTGYVALTAEQYAEQRAVVAEMTGAEG